MRQLLSMGFFTLCYCLFNESLPASLSCIRDVLCWRRWVTLTGETFPCFLHNLMSLQVTSWCSIWSSSVRVRGRGFRCGEWRTWSWFLFLRVCTEGSTAETLTWFSTALRIAEEACSTTCTTGKVLHPVLILHYTCTNDKIYWHWIQKYFLKTFLWRRSSLF